MLLFQPQEDIVYGILVAVCVLWIRWEVCVVQISVRHMLVTKHSYIHESVLYTHTLVLGLPCSERSLLFKREDVL